MEALLLVLVEAIAAPLLAAISAIGAFLSSVGAAVLSLAYDSFVGRRARRAKDPAAPPRRRWPRIVAAVIGGAAALVAIGVVVVDLFFFTDVARYALAKQHERTGIVIEAGHVEGSLFSGRVHATDVVVRRDDPARGRIDLRIARVDATVRVWNVLAAPREIDALTIVGARGRFERTTADATNGTDGGGRGRRASFVVDALAVQDLDVTWIDQAGSRRLEVPVTLRSLTVAPLRSRRAAFDLLFRGNAEGTVAGRPFTITTSGDDTARQTRWHAEGLPVALLAARIGGPFALFTAGTVNVEVVDSWRRGDGGLVVDMDWSFVFDGVAAEVPASTSPLIAKIAKPVVDRLNRDRAPFPLSFRVSIDEQRFEGSASTEATELWRLVADAAATTLARSVGIDVEAVEATGRRVLDGAKKLMDEARKKKG